MGEHGWMDTSVDLDFLSYPFTQRNSGFFQYQVSDFYRPGNNERKEGMYLYLLTPFLAYPVCLSTGILFLAYLCLKSCDANVWWRVLDFLHKIVEINFVADLCEWKM